MSTVQLNHSSFPNINDHGFVQLQNVIAECPVKTLYPMLSVFLLSQVFANIFLGLIVSLAPFPNLCNSMLKFIFCKIYFF